MDLTPWGERSSFRFAGWEAKPIIARPKYRGRSRPHTLPSCVPGDKETSLSALRRAMTIQVTGKNLDVGEALRGYVKERVGQTVQKYIGRRPSGHVRVEKEHGEFRTDCTIHLWQGMSLEAHGVAADAYQSADLACERLEKRVRR